MAEVSVGVMIRVRVGLRVRVTLGAMFCPDP
jgi:hypothetical protein